MDFYKTWYEHHATRYRPTRIFLKQNEFGSGSVAYFDLEFDF
jgi:hypothetical protein